MSLETHVLALFFFTGGGGSLNAIFLRENHAMNRPHRHHVSQ